MSCTSFCQKSSGVDPDVPQLLQAILKKFASRENSKYVCVIDANSGHLISTYSPDGMPGPDICTAISALKRTASQFSATMNILGCPSLKLSGETHTFYCYDIGLGSGFLLSFYCDIKEKGSWDPIGSDIDDMIAELRLILHNVVS